MGKKILRLIPLAVVFGFIITLLFTASMDWKQLGDCYERKNPYVTGSIQRVECASLEYGYPIKFVYSTLSVDLSTLHEKQTVPVLIGVSSEVVLDKLAFIINVLLWSAVSLAVLYFFSLSVKPKKSKK